MAKMVSFMIIAFLFFAILPATADDFDIGLLRGVWSGKWVSDQVKNDNAPIKAIVRVDANINIIEIIMFQTPNPPAPAFSSFSIGIFKNGKVIIDAASSGIEEGGSEMVFWLESPMILRGTYKNKVDSGKFELRRAGGKDA